MSLPPINSQNDTEMLSDIEILARETDTPVAIVQEVYASEYANLDQVARIKTHVRALTRRRVKELLQAQRSRYEVGFSDRTSD